MSNVILILLAILYVLAVGCLFAYGVNFFYLSIQALKKDCPAEGRSVVAGERLPNVTVQLPIFNELYVAERIIDAAASLDYPRELLQIQVLDDSTDETRQIVQSAVMHHHARGINIALVQRSKRQGYKAGALQAGLESAEGEFIAMFDADFVPAPDFLSKVLPHFRENTAFIQTRWGHLNREYSLLTMLQALAIDAHFMVEQFARWMSGLWFNFNGTAGIWRRSALDDAGGWRADTLTEDLDISYRALLKGWKARFLPDVEVPAELPVSIVAFRRQQHRWARGSLECALKLLPDVWASSASLWIKLSATLHLTGYAVHLCLFLLSLLYPAVLQVGQQYPQLLTLFGVAYVFGITALAPTFFFIVGQQRLKRRWWRSLPRILFITAVGSGLMVNTVRAALQILTKKQNVFERTAKFGIDGKSRQPWMGKRYQLSLDPIVYWELALAAMNLNTLIYAWRLGNWGVAFYAGVFLVGLVYVAGLSLSQAMAVFREQNASRSSQSAALPLNLDVDTLKGGD